MRTESFFHVDVSDPCQHDRHEWDGVVGEQGTCGVGVEEVVADQVESGEVEEDGAEAEVAAACTSVCLYT